MGKWGRGGVFIFIFDLNLRNNEFWGRNRMRNFSSMIIIIIRKKLYVQFLLLLIKSNHLQKKPFKKLEFKYSVLNSCNCEEQFPDFCKNEETLPITIGLTDFP